MMTAPLPLHLALGQEWKCLSRFFISCTSKTKKFLSSRHANCHWGWPNLFARFSTTRLAQELTICGDFLTMLNAQINNLEREQAKHNPEAVERLLVPLYAERTKCEARAREIMTELSTRPDLMDMA